MDMNAMLNQDLSTIPDLGDYVTPKIGVYKVTVDGLEQKEVADKPVVEAKYTILEVMEGGEDGDGDECKPGDKFSQLYFFSTEKGSAFSAQALKKLLSDVVERFGSTNLPQAMEAAAGCEAIVVIKHQLGKDATGKPTGAVYAQVSKLKLV